MSIIHADVSADVLARDADRSLVERWGRSAAKTAVRRVGMLTAHQRPVPDFLIVGAKRGGTTSFMNYLQQHPGVIGLFPRAEKIKGLYYFDEQYARGERWYRSHFPATMTRREVAMRTGHRAVSGEASPYYLFHPLAPERAAALAPDAQIVVLLRNPIERAFSHWKERRRNNTEPLQFSEALAAESERLAGEAERLVADPTARSVAHRHQSYIAQGTYAPMIERWNAAFARDQVLVMTSEEVFADPQTGVNAVADRLGLPHRPLLNPDRLNAEPSADLDPAIRGVLAERLTPAIQATESLVGRSLGWT